MKKVSVEFTEQFGTVIDYEMTDEDYESYEKGEKELCEILGYDIYEDADHDFAKYGSDGINVDVLEVKNV